MNCAASLDQLGDFGHLGNNTFVAGGPVFVAGAWMWAGLVLGYRVEIKAGPVLAQGKQ